ncbi:hypothetical protein KIPB_001303 [Kipferlia bialata]|uniref:Uncharacterized protein n=1 Tax=Kipferlia bialata TaxID=797122 RepID=A0A9K3CQC6_9EUKA|nr:hypothetical protein KIPB_001303 [Kipferlia bialata]|eukprot:g1303.t1
MAEEGFYLETKSLGLLSKVCHALLLQSQQTATLLPSHSAFVLHAVGATRTYEATATIDRGGGLTDVHSLMTQGEMTQHTRTDGSSLRDDLREESALYTPLTVFRPTSRAISFRLDMLSHVLTTCSEKSVAQSVSICASSSPVCSLDVLVNAQDQFMRATLAVLDGGDAEARRIPMPPQVPVRIVVKPRPIHDALQAVLASKVGSVTLGCQPVARGQDSPGGYYLYLHAPTSSGYTRVKLAVSGTPGQNWTVPDRSLVSRRVAHPYPVEGLRALLPSLKGSKEALVRVSEQGILCVTSLVRATSSGHEGHAGGSALIETRILPLTDS